MQDASADASAAARRWSPKCIVSDDADGQASARACGPPGHLPTKVILAVGPSGSGKTALVRRFVEGVFAVPTPPTVGLETATRSLHTNADDLADELVALEQWPRDGRLDLEIWEIGGKGSHRQRPRGRDVDGLLLCYDVTDRSSFQRAAHVFTQHQVDRHLEFGRSQGIVACSHAPTAFVTVLCGTKADEVEGDVTCSVNDEEVRKFTQANGVRFATVTSAKTGKGVSEVFQLMARAILEAEQLDIGAQLLNPMNTEAWSLGCPADRVGSTSSAMTSPSGVRPHEPKRGTLAAPLVEVLDQHHVPFATRTLQRCLENGLLHRAVHVWLARPSSGALLLRRNYPLSPKQPGRRGPTCCTEVLCYGSGDGHGSETSTQAAERCLLEDFPDIWSQNDGEVGVDTTQIGSALEHWFSCTSKDGKCQELLDVYVVAAEPREVSADFNWTFFGDIFGEVADASDVFHVEPEYRAAMNRELHARLVARGAK